MTEQPVIPPVEAKPAELPSRLANAARRARYAIFWERVWPPLAALATAAGLFLALSWLGLWLWLPHDTLTRAVGRPFPWLWLDFGLARHLAPAWPDPVR